MGRDRGGLNNLADVICEHSFDKFDSSRNAPAESSNIASIVSSRQAVSRGICNLQSGSEKYEL